MDGTKVKKAEIIIGVISKYTLHMYEYILFTLESQQS